MKISMRNSAESSEMSLSLRITSLSGTLSGGGRSSSGSADLSRVLDSERGESQPTRSRGCEEL